MIIKELFHFIKKELVPHAFDYSIFAFSGIIFLMAMRAFRGQPFWETIALFVFISFYIIWGIYHHILDGSIHLKTVIEYMLIGFTIFFLIKIILFP